MIEIPLRINEPYWIEYFQLQNVMDYVTALSDSDSTLSILNEMYEATDWKEIELISRH